MLDDIQARYSTLYRLGSNTGASFQAMRELLSAAFPSTQLYYFLRLSTFVNEPFRSKAQKLLAQVLRKRHLQVPTTMTQLLLPPLHVRDWKAQLGTWLQRWVASRRGRFPSLFLPKIRVVETRSATLGDRIYNYRKWQRRWTPDTSFPCRCTDGPRGAPTAPATFDAGTDSETNFHVDAYHIGGHVYQSSGSC